MKMLAFFTISLISTPVFAATFTPGNSAELQSALTTAEASTEDDVIQLSANTTYAVAGANTPFTYNSTNDGSLTLTGAGVGSTILDGSGSSQIMSLISISAGSNAAFTVQGITFQNGNNTVDAGGALSIENVNGTVQIQNTAFSNNSDSTLCGALSVESFGPGFTLTNSTFVQNETGGDGGAACISLGSNSVITGNTFTGNQAPAGTGGALVVLSPGGVDFQGNTFTGNTSGSDVGGLSMSAGSASVTFNNNVFSQNVSGGSVGAGVIIGGSLSGENNVISNNEAAGVGGGVLIIASTGDILFNANTVTGNTSGDNVGGLELIAGAGSVTFTNNILASNGADASIGGGLIIGGVNADIINNTVYGNTTAVSGGGLLSAVSSDASVLHLYNNIFFANTGTSGEGQDMLISTSSGPNALIQIFNNDFSEICFDDGGTPNCDVAAVLGANQGSNINVDPLLIDPTDGNFNLGLGSPAIDTGDVNAPNLPATDLAGNPRIFGGGVDMGALEAVPSIATDPASIAFGEVAVQSSESQVLTITNQGAIPLAVDGMSLSDGENFSIDPNGGSNPCGSLTFTLDGGESCTVVIVFSPPAIGTFDATLTISSNDPDQTALAVSLTGTGQLSNLTGGGCAMTGLVPSPMSVSWLLLPLLFSILRRKKN